MGYFLSKPRTSTSSWVWRLAREVGVGPEGFRIARTVTVGHLDAGVPGAVGSGWLTVPGTALSAVLMTGTPFQAALAAVEVSCDSIF